MGASEERPARAAPAKATTSQGNESGLGGRRALGGSAICSPPGRVGVGWAGLPGAGEAAGKGQCRQAFCSLPGAGAAWRSPRDTPP